MKPLVCEWRERVLADTNLPSTTRLVLLTLSVQDGSSCHPSTRRLAKETGLSERSVITHLENAVTDGWIGRKAELAGRPRLRVQP